MKKPYRTDGLCPMCELRPRVKRSYCAKCDNKRRRELQAGIRQKQAPIVRDANGLCSIDARVLNLMCNGLESGQIAKRMGYSLNTIKQRRSQMLEITGRTNSQHLVAWVVVNGYYKPLESSKSNSVFTAQNNQSTVTA